MSVTGHTSLPVVPRCYDTRAMGNATRLRSNAVRFRVFVMFLGSLMVSAVAWRKRLA